MLNWPIEERPREKLLTQGAASLSDAELLAIFYRVGIPGQPVLSLARAHLLATGSLRQLLDTPYKQAQILTGMSLTKYVSLQAGLELGKRYLHQTLKKTLELNSLACVIDYLRLQLREYPHEVVIGLFLDIKNKLIQSEELAQGGLASAQIYPRTIVKQALAYNAAGLIVAHNHPSGDPNPSQADKTMTTDLKQLLDKIEIRLLDHIILGEGCYFSFAEQGYI